MMTGEGGMLITDNDEIAEIARMVRNHGEVVLEGQRQRSYRADMLGWNYRMTELEAALGIEQLKKLDKLNDQRIELADYLSEKLIKLDGLTPPVVGPHNKHVYYIYAIKYDEGITGIPRDLFVKALAAEGIPCGAGYVKALYLNPIYHENKPFIFKYFGKDVNYDKGICPVTEQMHEKTLMMIAVCRPPAKRGDMDDIVEAMEKILGNRSILKS